MQKVNSTNRSNSSKPPFKIDNNDRLHRMIEDIISKSKYEKILDPKEVNFMIPTNSHQNSCLDKMTNKDIQYFIKKYFLTSQVIARVQCGIDPDEVGIKLIGSLKELLLQDYPNEWILKILARECNPKDFAEIEDKESFLLQMKWDLKTLQESFKMQEAKSVKVEHKKAKIQKKELKEDSAHIQKVNKIITRNLRGKKELPKKTITEKLKVAKGRRERKLEKLSVEEPENIEPNILTEEEKKFLKDTQTKVLKNQEKNTNSNKKLNYINIPVYDASGPEVWCVFCKLSSKNAYALKKAGYFHGPLQVKEKNNETDAFFHISCAMWAPMTTCFVEPETQVGTFSKIIETIALSKRCFCNVCHKRGAGLGCFYPKCKKSFHYLCAKQLKCLFDMPNVYCPDHIKLCTNKALNGKKEDESLSSFDN